MDELAVFNRFPGPSKVWIFQSSRMLKPEEINTIDRQLDNFTSQWTAHGKKLDAKAKVIESMFLIVMVNESYSLASGCSIDKIFNLLKEFETQFSITLFDRFKIAYTDQKDQINILSKSDLKKLLSEQPELEEKMFYNNVVKTKDELLQNWKIPIKESWLVNA